MSQIAEVPCKNKLLYSNISINYAYPTGNFIKLFISLILCILYANPSSTLRPDLITDTTTSPILLSNSVFNVERKTEAF